MRGFKISISQRFCRAFDEVRNFLRPASYINQNVSLTRRRTIHVQRVAALRDLISVADTASGSHKSGTCATCPKSRQNRLRRFEACPDGRLRGASPHLVCSAALPSLPARSWHTLLTEPDHQRAALAQASLVGLPVRHLVAGSRDPVATIGIVLVRHA